MKQQPDALDSGISINGLNKAYGKSAASGAFDVDIAVDAGQIFVLLGPSGCGKSTTLRCIAGLEKPDSGRIQLHRDTVFDSSRGVDVPTERRGLGMVFQNYGLWPHMTVRDNIAFPLKMRKGRRGVNVRDVQTAAEMVECGNLLDRYPWQLSGGQQQRVALARALVAKPRVLLMDEPLSNLDARLRRDLRIEIARLHKEIGFTAVYVTHDQTEALALGHVMAVMKGGRIVARGAPAVLFQQPPDEWTADFLGATNRIETNASVCRFRPDAVELVQGPAASEGSSSILLTAPVSAVVHVGDKYEYLVGSGSGSVLARLAPQVDVEPIRPGDFVGVRVAPDNLFVFPR